MKVARQLSIAILFLLCISSLYGSYQMINDSTGSSLGLPYYLLNGTVFDSYAPIGWILFSVVGVFSGVTIICIMKKTRFYSFLIMLQGVLLCIFIFMLMLLLAETFLVQYLFIAAGIALIGLGVLQNQRRIAVEAEKKLYTPQKSHPHKHRKD